MLRTKRTVFALALLALGALAPASTPAAEDHPLALAVRAVPRHHQWSVLAPDQRERLLAIVRLTPGERERWTASPSAVERGLGLFAAEQNGDIEFLLSRADLLESREPTIPYAPPLALGQGGAPIAQTLGEYLTAIYQDWFGVDANGSRARFDRLFGRQQSPALLVKPWIVRLQRARDDEQAVAAIKKQIYELPEEVRWAVVTLAYKNSLMSEEEARGQLARLSKTTKSALAAGAELLPGEPMFLVNGGLLQRTLLEECRRLL